MPVPFDSLSLLISVVVTELYDEPIRHIFAQPTREEQQADRPAARIKRRDAIL
jgi:hypothetical protein